MSFIKITVDPKLKEIFDNGIKEAVKNSIDYYAGIMDEEARVKYFNFIQNYNMRELKRRASLGDKP